MNPIFEAKYINITWADKNSALSIKESTDVIPLNIIDATNYQLDAITYSKVDRKELGQIAFRILDDIDYVPYFETNNFARKELRSVKDNLTGKIWWIEGEEWSKSNNRWQSEIFRSVGEVTVILGPVKCIVHIGSSSFSYQDLELYLRDFRNDFWYLILHEANYIQAEAKNKSIKILDSSSIVFIKQFIDFATKVIENPKKELREIQSLKISKKVRPVPRTFMEIATKGQQKLLTSRDYKDSYNVAENKYVYYIVNRIHILLNNLTKVTSYISENQTKQLSNYQDRLSRFSNFKLIDKEAVENEIQVLEEKLGKDNLLLEYALINQSQVTIGALQQQSIIIQLEKIYYDENSLSSSGSAKNNIEDNWFSFQHEKSSFLFIFDINIFKYKLEDNNEYEILGYIKDDRKEKIGGGILFLREFVYISNIKVINSKTKKQLDDTIAKKNIVEANNWQRRLTPAEKQEQAYEENSIKKSIEISQKQQEFSTSLNSKFKPLLSTLTSLKNKFSHLNIKQDSHFPNSMAFIQNPNYQGVHKCYKQIINLSGLDEELFLGLQEIEKIGILNVAMIYERWCLLQIIKILIDTYHYLPEKDWKTKLINQTLNVGRNVRIDFDNKDVCRKLTLWYEKELPSGKRPDFVLDVQSTLKTDDTVNIVDSDEPVRHEYPVHRLVMDAKFYEHINAKSHGGISTIINNLYHNGNYSEDNKNSVFILHPSKHAVPVKKTPQEWANNSYYGETQMFHWDKNMPNHKYGAILLSPMIRQGNYLDDLHRLIGMFLQYGMDDNLNANKRRLGKEKIFCLACGSDKQTPIRSDDPNKKWFTCEQCKHFTAYNYCGKCKNKLIKNGSYWTYHATKALEPANIKCPSCGDFFEISKA